METKTSTFPKSISEARNGGSRPVSFYDNYSRENGYNGNNNTGSLERSKSRSLQNTSSHLQIHKEITFLEERNPTQMMCLNTTVPQNIAGPNFSGRHTPTRNSLRHSRMIVLSRMGKVPKKSLPPIIRFHKLAKGLAALHTLLGVALCFLSLWLFVWTPNLKARDNCFWSALPLLCSGVAGLLLLYCCRKEYPGMPGGNCVYSSKVLSIFLSTLASVTCLTACTFALIHLISLSAMNCESPTLLSNVTCVCKLSNKDTFIPIKSYHYKDLSCAEVSNVLTILLIFSAATNLIGGVVAVWYVYLFWSSRYSYTYSKVCTKENTPVVYINS
nr:uncharacterized protein LOC111421144 isoform X1 [Onthophagus taurus]XP_022910055.1 uncharacterized protein LOC111421144 isoform X1 [Onthophagus taurus]